MKLTEIFEKNYYPDKTFYVDIKNQSFFESSFNKTITCKINDYEDLIFLAHCKDIYNQFNQNIYILIPCLIEQQADRRFHYSESFGLKIATDFINSLNFLGVSLFHPHSDVSSGLLNKCNTINNTNFIKEVLKDLDTDNLILFSSDAGGFKPLMKLVDELNWKGETYSASKSRKYEDGKSKLIQVVEKDDFEGKDILIIDDMCLYGGTFLGLSALLKVKNVGKLYLAVSHITIKSPNRLLESSFEKIFTTNSKYDEYDLDNLTIVKQF